MPSARPLSQNDTRRVFDAAALSALLGRSWAITEQGRQQVIAGVTYALQARDAPPLVQTRTACTRGSVAVIPVAGPLSKSPWWFGCDYETILKDFTAACEAPEVKAIVLDVDSPGGLTDGVHELSECIWASRGKKPIVAYVSGCAASAAYWIASACDRIVATQTAKVGSIGCFATLVDSSELMNSFGIKEYNIANEQSPYKVLDASKPEDRARVQTLVNQLASVFIADVAAYRGVSTDTVEARFGKGDVLVAQAALAAKMIDGLGDFESLIAELNAAAESSPAATAVARRASLKVVSKSKTKAERSSPTVRAKTRSEMEKPDLEKMKEHADAMYEAAFDEKHDGDGMKAAKAMAPHMKAMHEEMGEHSPFYDDDDDDDDGEKAQAVALVAELGGVKAARGAIAAMNKTAQRVEALEKEAAQAKAEKQATELKALLDEAILDGRVAPADRAEMEKLHAEAGIVGLKACLSRLPRKATPAREPSASANAPAPVAVAAATLTQAEMVLAQRRGKKPEEFAAFKAQYMAALKSASAQDKE